MTDYSSSPLVKKLNIGSDFKIHVVNPPENYLSLLGDLPSNVQFTKSLKNESLDMVHFFVKDSGELNARISDLKNAIHRNGMVWISWPKMSSGFKTDINGNYIRATVLETGLVDSKVCSVDDTWSALKFVYRKTDR